MSRGADAPIDATLVRETLPNGLRTVIAPRPGVSTVSVVFGARAGARFEPIELNGISHVLEHMMFRGAARFPSAHAVNLAIEEVGGTLDATTHVDFTTYELRLPSESFELGLERFAAVLEAPLFLDLALEKRILEEELREDLSDDGKDVSVDNLARRLLFGEHGLGRSITGTLTELDRITEEDLRAYRDRCYVGTNASLAISGPIDVDDAARRVRDLFGFFAKGTRLHDDPPEEALSAERFASVRDSGSQTDVRLSFRTFGESHPDMMALELLGRVLGEGMASRVQRKLRDELGLAYDCFAGIDPCEDVGALDLGGSVDHGKVPELVRTLHGLVTELAANAVPEEELARVARRFVWDLRAMHDDPHGLASYYCAQTLFGRYDTLEDDRLKALSVTREDLRRVAAAVLHPKAGVVACVGHLTHRLEDKVRAIVEGW
jgi:predicted Zn-dependent peptidase